MNVNNIHNSSFHNAVPQDVVAQARALANWHEYGIFTSPSLAGIGNSMCYSSAHASLLLIGDCYAFQVAGRAALPSILEGLQNVANNSNPLKFVLQAASYKPFLSLFNMTAVGVQNPQLSAIGMSVFPLGAKTQTHLVCPCS
jgi:prostatic aicd phosphatase